MEAWSGASNSGVVGDCGGAQRCGVIAIAVLDGVAVVGSRWIAIGNSDAFVVFDRIGEC